MPNASSPAPSSSSPSPAPAPRHKRRRLANIGLLMGKEFQSLRRDYSMLAFVIYAFTFAIYIQANGMSHDLHQAPIAVVDNDRSTLSETIVDALLPPRFQTPVAISADDIDRTMDDARYIFVLDIPPDFQSDVLAGRSPSIQLLIDATAVMQAGLGSGYIQEIVNDEVTRFVTRSDGEAVPQVALSIRIFFNQSLESSWFTGAMGLINNITMLSVLLSGAALIREREHGTLEHLLVLPVGPTEIMLGKVFANGLVVLGLTAVSILGVLQGLLGMEIAGSVLLFLTGVALYLFFTAALGIFLGTIAGTMPQFGLLFFLVVLPMNMLSGGFTPLESMPHWLQVGMQVSPSTQFVALSQAILYRGAGLDVVWPRFLAVGAIGLLFYLVSLKRFRHFLAAQQ
ncbi:ABC-2 type transport system permease protein [Pseudoxanthobacter soli DSM 19599]|uniref:ABC-2 type transport system permease protein n=1 Tax=Pseudoxanthobacter soli DSM 19599 TaxID=1123029 RepID=A0A1M7ZBU0_9HYPH|nr:ABC-2 type transport system permease protein [Pseudoxanthobacter soli DSM 19599]